jgi:hypothetical protein
MYEKPRLQNLLTVKLTTSTQHGDRYRAKLMQRPGVCDGPRKLADEERMRMDVDEVIPVGGLWATRQQTQQTQQQPWNSK